MFHPSDLDVTFPRRLVRPCSTMFSVCHSSPRNPRETDGRTRHQDPAYDFADRLARARTNSHSPPGTQRRWVLLAGRRVEHGHVRICQESVVRVRRNLRESSTPGKGICGRLPSRDKTENGPPNQLGSDVPRIVHGRRLLPISRRRLAVAAAAGTRRKPIPGAPPC